MIGRKEADYVDVVATLPALRAFARTFCPNQTDADDLVQETLLRALNAFDTFTPGTRLKSWLFTIMRNSFYTDVKKRAREAPGAKECISDTRSVAPSQEISLQAREVREALSTLPDHQREVLVMVTMLGVSYEEAAEVCGCSVGTIKSRINRARARLLAELGEEPKDLLVVPYYPAAHAG